MVKSLANTAKVARMLAKKMGLEIINEKTKIMALIESRGDLKE